MNEVENKNKIAVLGVGNLLMKDDGLGVHAVHLLEQQRPDGADIYDIGTSSLKMQDLMEQYPFVIILDAVQTGAQPGTLYRLNGNSLSASESHSLHDMGVAEILQMIPESKRPSVVVLGVEPEKVEWSIELSKSVRDRVVDLIKAVKETIRETIEHSSGQEKRLCRL